jgi:hypothetical protein
MQPSDMGIIKVGVSPVNAKHPRPRQLVQEGMLGALENWVGMMPRSVLAP